MKKVSAIFLFVSFLLFYSCAGADGGGSSGDSGNGASSVSLTKSVAWDTSENDTFVVEENVKSVTITGNLSGKKIYCATVNTSGTAINGENYTKIAIDSTGDRSLVGADVTALLPTFDSFSSDNYICHSELNFTPPNISVSSSARTIDNPASSNSKVTQLTDTVGSTKTLYVSLEDDSAGNPVKKEATLRACNETCNVWVLDDYYDETSAGTKVNTDFAKKIAEKFKSLYPLVRNVYGNESDKIYYPVVRGNTIYFELFEMDYLSDTGTKVNIVIYDLYGDADQGKVLGFFAPRDYYPNDDDLHKLVDTSDNLNSYSNEGKYFYIDSYFLNNKYDDTISTLAHEFQHMIHYSVKKMSKGKDSDTNFNEMFSMLCEDMMQEFLGLEDKDSPKARLQSFVTSYTLTGIREYNSESPSTTTQSYANAYAFGAWLCRQYGGAALVKEMMENDYTNNECIVAAVNKLNNGNYTFDDLFAQFVKACFGKDSTYTFNKDAASSLSYSGYNYPMKAINLWKKNSLYDMSSSVTEKRCFDPEYSELGPIVYQTGTYLKSFPAEYGTLLTRVKSFSNDFSDSSYTLNFVTKSGVTKPGMKLFLYIK
ncbi:hypothetical protein [Treponema sp. UBA3813]|uniref:hypothetical protein n=1 Tax=Treponema sp. UBA3813 TaxID=1947715 RepID=UPI0025F31E92|nr:hypothetical protein [Treponema sp. UBA3813]